MVSKEKKKRLIELDIERKKMFLDVALAQHHHDDHQVTSDMSMLMTIAFMILIALLISIIAVGEDLTNNLFGQMLLLMAFIVCCLFVGIAIWSHLKREDAKKLIISLVEKINKRYADLVELEKRD